MEEEAGEGIFRGSGGAQGSPGERPQRASVPRTHLRVQSQRLRLAHGFLQDLRAAVV